MSSPPALATRGVTRRGLLAGSAAAVALLLAGCTSGPSATRTPAVDREASALADQVPVQAALVAAYRTATAADPGLGTRIAGLADQAGRQLTRLKAAAPGANPSASSSAASSASTTASTASAQPGPPAGQDPATWLRAQITATADSHADTCLDLTGARAALLGSIAAGLRGQAAQLT